MVLELREYADHQEGRYITPVFDNVQEFMAQADQEYAGGNLDGKLGNMYVSTTRDHFELQAADFVAFEFRETAQLYIKTRRFEENAAFSALAAHNFRAGIWDYRRLDYLRRRVEAVTQRVDPDTVIEGSQG